MARYCFHVPGVAEKWRWGFYSCNGLANHPLDINKAEEGVHSLWKDVLHCHQQLPLHAMIGGGDQICCDDVWNLPALIQWLRIEDRSQRLAFPFTQEMADQVEWFFFTNYIK